MPGPMVLCTTTIYTRCAHELHLHFPYQSMDFFREGTVYDVLCTLLSSQDRGTRLHKNLQQVRTKLALLCLENGTEIQLQGHPQRVAISLAYLGFALIWSRERYESSDSSSLAPKSRRAEISLTHPLLSAKKRRRYILTNV
jgi:hypothetical protein